jgi:hypothetical protein
MSSQPFAAGVALANLKPHVRQPTCILLHTHPATCCLLLPVQNVILASHIAARKHAGSHPDPRSCLDSFNNTPYQAAKACRQRALFLLKALNPATSIEEVQRLCSKHLQQTTTAEGLALPANLADSPMAKLAVGE